MTIVRAHRHPFIRRQTIGDADASRKGLTPTANLYSGIRGFILERISRTILGHRLTSIEPEPKSIGIGARRFFETGFVDEAEVAPPLGALQPLKGNFCLG